MLHSCVFAPLSWSGWVWPVSFSRYFNGLNPESPCSLKRIRSSAQGNCSAKSLAALVMLSILLCSSILPCPPCLPPAMLSMEGGSGLGGVWPWGVQVGGGGLGEGRGQGTFHPPCHILHYHMVLAQKGLRTISSLAARTAPLRQRQRETTLRRRTRSCRSIDTAPPPHPPLMTRWFIPYPRGPLHAACCRPRSHWTRALQKRMDAASGAGYLNRA